MTVAAVVYRPDGVRSFDDPAAARAADGTTWVRVAEPTPSETAAVREAFDLHPLTIEDVQNGVRPKTEAFDAYTFVLVKAARLRVGETTFEQEVAEQPVGCFVGDDWLVTVAPEEPAAVDRAWSAVERGEVRLVERGPDFAAYRVIDGVVDGYFDLLDGIEDRLERVEDEVIEEPDVELLEEINSARRELLSVRKLLWPTREAVGVLARGDPPHVQQATEKYFRDVYDHVVQLVDLVETYRDLATGARDIYLNALSVSTNEVMKKLTVVATIVLPLTLVVGVYGMNFGGSPFNMAELGWEHSYLAVMLGMGLVVVVLVDYFRREDWL